MKSKLALHEDKCTNQVLTVERVAIIFWYIYPVNAMCIAPMDTNVIAVNTFRRPVTGEVVFDP